MFNYYLLNRSYEDAAIDVLQQNFQELNEIVVVNYNDNDVDYFLKHETIWSVKTREGLLGEILFNLDDKQFSYNVLPRLLESISSVENEILDFEAFDEHYAIYNAFYGILFTNDLDQDRCISNKAGYDGYRARCLWDLTPETLWTRRSTLFKNVIFCPSIEADLKLIGGAYLSQIIDRIKALDRYQTQNVGEFNYRDCNEKTSLNISPESQSTMRQKKLMNLRVFSMPDGKRAIFELHIKTGNLRIHIYPENGKIYIGYIGKHLQTATYS